MIKVNISKKLSKFMLNVNFNFNNNFIYLIEGKSGSGKTTFLRILSGLNRSEGEIIVDGKVWQNEKIFLPPQKRDIGFVFQDLALFPHMNVIENLLFVKKDKKLANEILSIVGLNGFENRYPINLSGGEKQRVAIARALMKKPKILLLDEPFSALDLENREIIKKELQNIKEKFKTTIFIVSHNKEDELFADKIFKMENGKMSLKEKEFFYCKGKLKDNLIYLEKSTKKNEKVEIFYKVMNS
ncbi:MAG: ATP-binding cassette domain-containing protein [Nautiliaceae bacterium]